MCRIANAIATAPMNSATALSPIKAGTNPGICQTKYPYPFAQANNIAGAKKYRVVIRAAANRNAAADTIEIHNSNARGPFSGSLQRL